jgi:glucose-6-phosphate 1-dehydrogenase
MTGDNPLLEPTVERVAPPAAIVVFGASGDLTSRKLMPAVERLALRRLLPAGFSVVGVGRTPMYDEDFRERMRTLVEEGGGGGDEAKHVWDAFRGGFRYVAGDYGDTQTYAHLGRVLDELDRERGTAGNRLYYLATPPATFPVIVGALGQAGLNRPPHEGALDRKSVV